MIIDSHSHLSSPESLWAYKAGLLASRGSHGRGKVAASDDELLAALQSGGPGGRLGHLPYMDLLGHDMHLISPRPYQAMSSERPVKIVQWFTEETNELIYRHTQLFPDRFVGIAGLPQVAGENLDLSIKELERCVKQLGFRGCLINPDPYENSGTEPPAMGDRYWYPLYEKLCELDVPGHIHSAGSKSEREPYSLHFINEETTAVFGLLNSTVFDDFPTLKIMCSHGGGAIPYQIGRFEAATLKQSPNRRFSQRLKNLYFDTTLYNRKSIELLIDVVGVDNCLLGSEVPGTGSVDNPDTGRKHDDVVWYIRQIEGLSDQDRDKLFYQNAVKLFGLQNIVKNRTAKKAAE
jgi:OH-DDVA meta-cleavage compound hydrolase